MSRPTDKTAEVVRKIEEAAAMDCTIEEMAFFANIHRATLYRWINNDKEFSDRITELRNTPILKARQAVVKGLDNYQNSMDYLKRKRKDEFGDNSKIEVKADIVNTEETKNSKEILKLKEQFEQELKKKLLEK